MTSFVGYLPVSTVLGPFELAFSTESRQGINSTLVIVIACLQQTNSVAEPGGPTTINFALGTLSTRAREDIMARSSPPETAV